MSQDKVPTEEELAQAKRNLVADLLNPSEIDQVSGGDGPPHWNEFTRFVMSPPYTPIAPAPNALPTQNDGSTT